MSEPVTEQPEPRPGVDDAHHADNQRRFIAMEAKIDANTTLTEKLAADMSGLLEMWQDAGVVFKWLRRFGRAVVFVRNVALALLAMYVAFKYGTETKT